MCKGISSGEIPAFNQQSLKQYENSLELCHFNQRKQRRYLWANEPEIARDWTDTYGSRIERDDGGIADLIEIIAREPAAFGGIMGVDGRRAYGLGKFY